MSTPVPVRVEWDANKLDRLPAGDRYITVAKFLEDGDEWNKEAWSVVLEFLPGTALSSTFRATARFLMPDAPWERMIEGCTFEMYEGVKRSAIVTVLGNSNS